MAYLVSATLSFPAGSRRVWSIAGRTGAENPSKPSPTTRFLASTCWEALDPTGHLQGLKLFLENPEIPLDNNLAERELRGVVLGRKNHYGSRSKRGTEVVAPFYSLLETAKLVGEEPCAYLLRATRAALDSPGIVTLPVAPGT